MKYDDLGVGEELPMERLARENMEADLKLLSDLRQMREELGLSQIELGRILGITQASVSAFEAENDPKLSTVRRYAHALNVAITHDVKPCEYLSIWGEARTTTKIAPIATGTAPISRSSATSTSVEWAANSRRNDFALAG